MGEPVWSYLIGHVLGRRTESTGKEEGERKRPTRLETEADPLRAGNLYA